MLLYFELSDLAATLLEFEKNDEFTSWTMNRKNSIWTL